MATMQKITPCLWFDSEAEEAAKFYVSIFRNSAIESISRYGKEGFEHHGKPEGSVLTVVFRLNGLQFTALNGGPKFPFTEAISLAIYCDDQAEVDHFWNRLSEGGQEGPCGWLKDRFGLSWQVVPRRLEEMMTDPDRAKVSRVMAAFLQMKKFDIAAIERAYAGS
jgi:predicted 3-demethylubiquinone-9 3-methyltransferase (glyoxalase superfamily)